ncbi:MAG: glycosyltransferase [Verrucomicrobia bacterium]|nr:glycosyltransferase [Verrucomicrobiota bacterium]MBV8482573.1 glycosyltransferase [Verrucomicrobiota bacterium]
MIVGIWLWFSVLVSAVLLIQFVLNLLLLPRLRPDVAPSTLPRVSVLLPARNEALGIRSCLESLLKQNYSSLEIIVLDDESVDATAEIAAALGFSTNREATCRLIRGAPLPPGWTGKSWACHQLAEVARGDYLLFTDADTVHQPETVSSAVAAAQRVGCDLLTLWPFQTTVTFAEKLVIPLMFVVGGSYLPHWLLVWAQRSPWLARVLGSKLLGLCGTATGQFLLFRRQSYFKMDGHRAVREHLVEDISLAREVAKRIPEGWRLVTCDGTRLVSCRMYTSLGQIWEGFTKNLWPVFDGAWVGFWLAIIWQFLICVLPFVIMAFYYRPELYLVAGILLCLRVVAALRFKTSWLSVCFHPIGYSLALVIAVNSFWQAKSKGITWKDRIYRDQASSQRAAPQKR